MLALNVRSGGVGLVILGACMSACSDDGLPAAPAMCQAPLTALTPWWTSNGGTTDACATGFDLTKAPLQARGGVVYYGASNDVCAVDASGIRTVASTSFDNRVDWAPVGGIWLDGDRVIYTDGVGGVYAAPLAGGDPVVLFPFPSDDLPSAYDYDGTFFTWSSVKGIFRRPLTAADAIENVLPGTLATRIYVTPDRVDGFSGEMVDRWPLSGAGGSSFDVTTSGDLLASTGDFTYVRYATQTVSSGGFNDDWFDLGVLDSGGTIARAWTGAVPRILPTAAGVREGTVYAGGRLHYHDGAVFVGVVAIAAGAQSGDVVGCTPTQLAPNREWAVVLSVAADDLGVYALVDRTDVQPTEHAIVRFPLP